jgi:hypothetical protein
MARAALETRVVVFSAADFIADPTLFKKVESAWRAKDWLLLFGEEPIGAVLATIDDGVTFHFKHRVPA